MSNSARNDVDDDAPVEPSSLRTQGPITPGVGYIKRHPFHCRNERDTAYGSLRSQGRQVDILSPSRDTLRPSFANSFAPKNRGRRRPSRKRAQGRPGARCTRGLVCKYAHQKRTRAYRFSGGSPAFPAQWCYGLFRALPGDRAFLPPSPARSLLLTNLMPASRHQDHTTSPSASATLVSRSHRVHRIPTRVS
jgi:hypothetical protein